MDFSEQPKAVPKHAEPSRRVVRLDDLDWEDDVVGGASGKLFFGEEPGRPSPLGFGFGRPAPDSSGPR